MNINLHIDSIVLDGIDLGPGESQLLQQSVVSQLTTMLTQQGLGSSINESGGCESVYGDSIHIGRSADNNLLVPQLAHAIYGSIPRGEIGTVVPHGSRR